MNKELYAIEKYFNIKKNTCPVGIGHDGAVINSGSKTEQIVFTTDLFVEGTHFFKNTDPEAVGYKSLAVNLSDLAAMGAKPKYALLSLAIPKFNEKWISKFSSGFFKLINKYQIELIGGDFCKGHLNIGVTAIGSVPKDKWISTNDIKLHDDIWVSGEIGNAAKGLELILDKRKKINSSNNRFITALEFPVPRLELGMNLRDIANCSTDLSDSLIQDIQKIIMKSKFGAKINFDQIPCDSIFSRKRYKKKIMNNILYGGDDYEIIFTSEEKNRKKILNISKKLNLKLTCIGKITKKEGLYLHDDEFKKIKIKGSPYVHF